MATQGVQRSIEPDEGVLGDLLRERGVTQEPQRDGINRALVSAHQGAKRVVIASRSARGKCPVLVIRDQRDTWFANGLGKPSLRGQGQNSLPSSSPSLSAHCSIGTTIALIGPPAEVR